MISIILIDTLIDLDKRNGQVPDYFRLLKMVEMLLYLVY